MTLIPSTFHKKDEVPDDIRECQGCHLKSMGKGDQAGWKGVDAGNGGINWYCDKTACQQARDDFIAKRQAEMIAGQRMIQEMAQNPAIKPVEQLDDKELENEEARLRTRLMAIKARRKSREEQSTAKSNLVLPVEQMVPLDPVEPEEVVDKPVSFEGVVVHQSKNGIDSLCGADGPVFVVGEELPDNCVPCVECAEIFESDQGVASSETNKTDAESEKKPDNDQSLRMDLSQLPRFSPDLIDDIVENGYGGGYILIPPSAYPDIDLETVDLNRIQRGVTSMFVKAGLEVDKVQRARKLGEFVGLVFTLRESAKK